MSDQQVVATNRKAFHDYFIEDKFEAGMVLQGTEVKALRERRVNLQDSFARIENGEVFLYHCHISPYSHGDRDNHEPLRVRKLLLHGHEINRLIGKTKLKGLTLVPLKIYFKRGRVKVELGVGRGKAQADKRQTIKKRMAEKEVQRAMKERRTSGVYHK